MGKNQENGKIGALIGAGVGLFLFTLKFFSLAIDGYLYRTPVAHTFPIGKFFWWLTKGLIPPLAMAKVLVVGFTVASFAVIGALAKRRWKEEKAKFAAVVLIGFLFWLCVMYYLNIPMMQGMHH